MQRLEVVRQGLPLHPQDEVECRRCGVHCDKVVYPSACVERGCPFLYSFEELGRTYVGCMQKVFGVEIDLELLMEAEERGEFGAVRANRRPLPMCRAEVESCYEARGDELTCVNPEFYELPLDEPSFRIFAQVKPSA
ncbi:MAG TPA: hypothetical protein VGQ68_07065 [Gaiellaceae bacterium]|jgi:hypothetical protein|nr:hypothetical protein [Gaiellaceae bacterium]